MGKLGTLGANFLLVSQKEIADGMGSLWIIFKMRHHSNEYFFVFEICTSIYVEILGLVSKKCPIFSGFAGNLRARKPNKAQKKRLNIDLSWKGFRSWNGWPPDFGEITRSKLGKLKKNYSTDFGQNWLARGPLWRSHQDISFKTIKCCFRWNYGSDFYWRQPSGILKDLDSILYLFIKYSLL